MSVTDEVERLRAENARLIAMFRQRCEQQGRQPQSELTSDEFDETAVHTVVILGASGDLAVKKLFPSIFGLYRSGLLPRGVVVVGYARSEMSADQFRAKVGAKLPQKLVESTPQFLAQLHYVHGGYEEEDFRRLSQHLTEIEQKPKANRLFYVSLPPTAFVGAIQALHAGAMPAPGGGWTRVVVEKPFGRDLQSARQLQCSISSMFDETSIYRIDHYLGKQMVMNLLALRFANIVFSPIWNRQYISCVQITFKEDIGTEGRGAYFDQAGIIRDVMQNHLVQVMALVGMEPPVTLSADDIRDEKVKVLRAVPPLAAQDIVIGQYEGYQTEQGVPANSTTPTYACARLRINNPRWDGVPFILKCGKGLSERKTEIRIQFRNGFTFLFPAAVPNELVVRIQPKESIYLKMMAKTPGLSKPTEITQTELDLTFQARFEDGNTMPDAYELLLRDVLRGDHSLFVRADELDAAWMIFTPALHELESLPRREPIRYKRGVRGLPEGDKFVSDAGYIYTSSSYKWPRA